jgi:phosphosulfolactate synthase (CoM biosynthesis protein A)
VVILQARTGRRRRPDHDRAGGHNRGVETLRTEAVAEIIDGLDLDAVMFEAADPPVFEWYIKDYGAAVMHGLIAARWKAS